MCQNPQSRTRAHKPGVATSSVVAIMLGGLLLANSGYEASAQATPAITPPATAQPTPPTGSGPAVTRRPADPPVTTGQDEHTTHAPVPAPIAPPVTPPAEPNATSPAPKK